MHKKIYFILLVFLSLNACKKEKASWYFQKNKDFIFELDPTGIASIPDWQVTLLDRGRVFSYFHLYDNSIKIFDFETQEIIYDLNFSKEGPDGVENTLAYYLDNDFLIIHSGTEIIKANYEGKVLERFSNDRISNATGIELSIGFNSNYRFETRSYDLKRSQFYVVAKSSGNFFDQSPGMIRIDFNSSDIQYYSLSVPEDHQKTRVLVKNFLIRDYCYPFLSIADEKLIYTYPGSSAFYILDLKKLNQKAHKLNPKPELNISLNFEKYNLAASNKELEFLNTNYYFGPVKYDPGQQLYYQIYFKPATKDATNGDLVDQAIWRIMEPESFNIIAQKEMEEKAATFRDWCVFNDGILLKAKPKEETKIPFYQYQLASK